MRKLSFIISAVLILNHNSLAQKSPHGRDFTISCSVCHSTKGWEIDKSIYSFDHNSTAMPLEGQHLSVNCKSCHPTLVFSDAKTGCSDCHTDIHSQTVGPDCERCHTPKSWLVENITEIHQRTRFPLVGPHNSIDCELCHKSASLLRFDPLGVECVDCHIADYRSAKNPDHVLGGFSTRCNECHLITGFSWTNANFIHNIFPLTLGHSNVNCSQCHTNGINSPISSECSSCHISNFNTTKDPNHIAANFPTTCKDCHTTNPGWQPALYKAHDSQFPIYSGKHNLQWSLCSDCHNNSSNYAQFTCTGCHAHNQQDMDSKHSGIGGYVYNSTFCLACHPTGSTEGSFNHNSTVFPLTGAHTTVQCNSCHTSGFAGTPTACSACHISNFNQTNDPNHSALGLSTSCESCHTANPGWKPATFAIHDNYYPLTGAHTTVDCSSCHKNGYSGTSKVCSDCHISNFNQTTNPNHTAIGLSTICSTCHTTNPGWKPAAFPNHNNYYVIAGAHLTIAANCDACHNGNYNTTPNTCIGCHQKDYNSTTNPAHATAQFPTSCEMCHTQNGWAPSTFNHDAAYFPIYSGKHNGQWTTCSECHQNPADFSSYTCISCHAHNQTDMNDSHSGVAGYTYSSSACYSCHPGGSAGGRIIHLNYLKKN